MKPQLCLCILLFAIVAVNANLEVDAIHAWMTEVADPHFVLLNWNPTEVTPCLLPHITCNSHNKVTRVDLSNAGLSGIIVPQLGMLHNLHYLEVSGNNISGSIPKSLGNLTSLISLDLSDNQITGSIPASLGNLRSLRYMRLNINHLTGKIPGKVIQLIFRSNLLEL